MNADHLGLADDFLVGGMQAGQQLLEKLLPHRVTIAPQQLLAGKTALLRRPLLVDVLARARQNGMHLRRIERRFQQITGGTELHRLLRIMKIPVSGQDDAADMRIPPIQLAEQLEPVHHRHGHVDKHDVGGKPFALDQRFLAVGRFSDDAEPPLLPRQARAQMLADFQFVVHQ